MSKPTTHQDLKLLPEALQPLADEKRWVNWVWTERPGKNGTTEWTKPPLQPNNPKKHAKSNDPATWDGYKKAIERVLDGDADGLGYMLLGSEVGAVDLDKCCTHDLEKDTVKVDEWARAICDEAGGYNEITVSGTGLASSASPRANDCNGDLI